MRERLLLGFGVDYIKTVLVMATESSNWLIMGKTMSPYFIFSFDLIFFKLEGNEDRHKLLEELKFRPDRTTPFRVRGI